MNSRLALFAPSLLLIVLAGVVAAGVQHMVSVSEHARVAPAGEGFGSPAIRLGSLVYPRQAIDSDSFVVHVAKPARRVVSQYWSIDDFVYSVIPAERVVAVSETAYLKSVSNVYQQVQRFRPAIASDPERVLRLNPDLLMVSNTSRADFCAIVRSADVPIYRTFTVLTTLDQIVQTLRVTGYLTGEERTAQEEIERFQNAIAEAKARRPANAPHPRILGFGGRSSYGKDTLFNDIVETLGGINVGAEGGLKGYDSISSEQIVRWNPEWIVTGANPGKTKEVLAGLLADPAIAATQAARSGHLLVFENHVMLPMSPFTRLLVAALAEALYG